MIISEYVMLGLGRNIKYLEKLGYNIPRQKDKKKRRTAVRGTKIRVILSDIPSKSRVLVEVKCEDCGIERSVIYSSLLNTKRFIKTGETLCNNCANHRMSGKNNAQYKHGSVIYPEYRCNAKKRGISFDLSPDEFKDIVKQQCHYCGRYSKDRNIKSRGNGVDRKNSNLGYYKDNCVPCCATCNFVKNSMLYSDFILYIRDLYNNTKHYEI